MLVTFNEWTHRRAVRSLGTNFGAAKLPFQNWRHFKEAFAPELIARAVESSKINVRTCLDPFGGSGTTALACQFLGVRPITIEVNPFLADLIEAKLNAYDVDALARDLGHVICGTKSGRARSKRVFSNAPATFVEPGLNGRWIFDLDVADRIARLLSSIDSLENDKHRKLFRTLLGGILVSVSNVIINGKGRRYRRGWESRRSSPNDVESQFCSAVQSAILEINRYASRACSAFDVRRGDCREVLRRRLPCDVAVFSPPYPNSFDYTDVYNLELWTLGYLSNRDTNAELRRSTLCSHVQLARTFSQPPPGSPMLDRTLNRLRRRRAMLWSRWIPEMIGAYFSDLDTVLTRVHRSLSPGGAVWMVVGDSRYAEVPVPTAEIVTQLVDGPLWKLVKVEPFRSMRASAQQGGQPVLGENLIVITKS